MKRNTLSRVGAAILLAVTFSSCALVEDTANSASNLLLGRDVKDCFARERSTGQFGAAQTPLGSAIERRQIEIVDSMGKGGLE